VPLIHPAAAAFTSGKVVPSPFSISHGTASSPAHFIHPRSLCVGPREPRCTGVALGATSATLHPPKRHCTMLALPPDPLLRRADASQTPIPLFLLRCVYHTAYTVQDLTRVTVDLPVGCCRENTPEHR
jgi:hypothetical protein